jgi:predicted ATPase
MKLKRVSVKGLNNKVDCDFEFHDDINIVTGINGCGKTTFLKMLWYTISGNIEHLISEISFELFNLETSNYSLHLSNKNGITDWEYVSNLIKRDGHFNDSNEYNPSLRSIEDLNSLIIDNKTSSLFFPTFRRIEGGYAMTNPYKQGRTASGVKNTTYILEELKEKDSINLQEGFDKLSEFLTVINHKFVCSISTHDLGLLLSSRHAEISERINEYSLSLNKSLINKIESIKSDIENIKPGTEDNKEESLAILSNLSKLQQEATNVNNKRDELLQPFKVLSELVIKVLHYKGVKLDDFTIGESDGAIDSRLLSAGEQQMLSFLCYNAFYEDSIIFIDEPELSLHVDWQRRLFPNLMKQQSSNQFIVATHSPCIYSKYPDKEIILSEEKGE